MHDCPARFLRLMGSCRPLHGEAGAQGSALVRLAGGVSVEGETGLARFGSWRGGSSHPLVEGATLHEIGPDQPGEGERAFDDAVGVMRQAQQQEGDERDDDLGAHRVLGGSEEVADLEGLFDTAGIS